MEKLFPNLLLNLLTISATFSIILMSLIQKIKTLSFITKAWQIWIVNLILSFLIGIPFSITFYHNSFKEAIWVGLFSFIGASTIYDSLKNQNVISYKPSSLTELSNKNKN